MPLADDGSVAQREPGEGFSPLFMDPTNNPSLPNVAPDPNPGAIGLDLFDNSIWTDNNLTDNPRSVRKTRAKYGAVILDVSAWFVDQFWIIPNPVNYGNIVSQSTITVTVFNSFRYVDQEVTAIDLAQLATFSVSITAGPTIPAQIRRSEQISFDFTAALAGAPSFDDVVDFTFDELP